MRLEPHDKWPGNPDRRRMTPEWEQLLNWLLNDEGVVVVTDTEATDTFGSANLDSFGSKVRQLLKAHGWTVSIRHVLDPRLNLIEAHIRRAESREQRESRKMLKGATQ